MSKLMTTQSNIIQSFIAVEHMLGSGVTAGGGGWCASGAVFGPFSKIPFSIEALF